IDEGRRPAVHPVWPVGAVADAVEPKLPFGRFDRRVDLFRGRLDHARDLAADLARLQPVQTLADDPDALAHFLNAADGGGVSVAVCSGRNGEVELGIALIRLGAAQIPFHARAPNDRPRQTVFDALFRGNDADAHGALLPDPVVCQQLLVVVDPRWKVIDELG